MNRAKKKTRFRYGFAGLVLILSIVLVLVYRRELYLLYHSSKALRAYIKGLGLYGALFFIGLQILQVIVFLIPGEVTQVTGGYIFGFWYGLLYSLIGITIGSIFNFFASRTLGKPFILRLFGSERVNSFLQVMDSPRAKRILFLLFLIPGLPKDSLCYVSGLCRYRFPFFLAVSTIGRLPGLIVSNLLGDAAALHAWRKLSIAGSIVILLFLAGIWGRRMFQKRLSKLSNPPDGGSAPHPGSPPEVV